MEKERFIIDICQDFNHVSYILPVTCALENYRFAFFWFWNPWTISWREWHWNIHWQNLFKFPVLTSNKSWRFFIHYYGRTLFKVDFFQFISLMRLKTMIRNLFWVIVSGIKIYETSIFVLEKSLFPVLESIYRESSGWRGRDLWELLFFRLSKLWSRNSFVYKDGRPNEPLKIQTDSCQNSHYKKAPFKANPPKNTQKIKPISWEKS